LEARPPRSAHAKKARAGGLVVALILASSPVSVSAQTTAPRLEIEEPGQIERAPVVAPTESEAPAPPDKSVVGEQTQGQSNQTADVELEPGEATTILPDSEAVDDSIEGDDQDDAEGDAEGGDTTATPADPKGPADEPTWSIRWQNAFIVQRGDDPTYQFLFGGRLQNDWGVYSPDDDLEASFGGDGTGTKFRRARLYFQGRFFRYGFFKAEYDFSEGEDGTKFADLYAGLDLPKIGLIRIGYFKEPFSLEWQSSSNFISFNERSTAFALTPDRNSGIMLNRSLFVRDSTVSIAVMRRSDDVGDGFSNKEDYHLTLRFTGLPYFDEGGRRLLHLEFGYSHQFSDQTQGTQYEQSAANDFATSLVDTGVLPVSDVDLFNVGLALVQGSFSLQTEFTLTLPRDGISENPIFWGGYGELSWWITGETRRYLRGRGVFSRVTPKRRFDPRKGQWGGLEAAARYSWLDLSNDGIRGGTLGEASVALNWTLLSNLRMSNNYVLSHTGDRPGFDSGIAHSWVTRFEVDF
jgi:phosphate-selective porin OprO/OprP